MSTLILISLITFAAIPLLKLKFLRKELSFENTQKKQIVYLPETINNIDHDFIKGLLYSKSRGLNMDNASNYFMCEHLGKIEFNEKKLLISENPFSTVFRLIDKVNEICHIYFYFRNNSPEHFVTHNHYSFFYQSLAYKLIQRKKKSVDLDIQTIFYFDEDFFNASELKKSILLNQDKQLISNILPSSIKTFVHLTKLISTHYSIVSKSYIGDITIKIDDDLITEVEKPSENNKESIKELILCHSNKSSISNDEFENNQQNIKTNTNQNILDDRITQTLIESN